MNRVDFQGEFWFPVTPERLWLTIEQFDLFASWWAWLREFRADGAGLTAGNVLHGTVVPPVPYRLRLDVRLQRCDRPRSVEARVDGDLRGRAALRLEDAGGGTRVAAAWSLEIRSVPLRLAARAAYPVMRWGHDRVVDMAVAGFRRRALPAAVATYMPVIAPSLPPRAAGSLLSGGRSRIRVRGPWRAGADHCRPGRLSDGQGVAGFEQRLEVGQDPRPAS